MAPKPLPVPDLQETVDRTVHAARAVLSADDVQELQKFGRAFLKGPAEQLQRRLVDFAHSESASGNSYVSRQWRTSYLTTRTPLPLTTSVAFQLEGFPKTPGIERAADFLHRAAHVHLQQLRGQTPQEVDPRGHHLDMDQWQVLGPGIRHPLPDCDELRRPEVSPDQAHIGLLLNGRLYTTPITDDDGAALPPSTITSMLTQLLEATADADPDEAVAGESFVDVSYLGSQTAAGLLEELLQNRANERVYQRLTEMVFVVDLLNDPQQSADQTDVDRLRSLAFAPGHAWAYKPVSYQLDLHSEWIGIHFEHSGADGATVRAAVDRMQQLEVPAEDSAAAAASSCQELHWEMTAGFRDKLRALVADYTQVSAELMVHDVTVPAPDLSSLDVKVSQDAVQQLLLTYAQLATFGCVRSVYESVDMREFRAGRTECLRALTPEAVACAQAMLDGKATQELFGQAMDAHRG
ncbi:choline/carnitine O-acyltransferase, partial [Kocuria sp. ZOR0020]|uniref:choline/carnitine O-acyltransferase n=1 Tax=Kocuria sp. ZOR0020 TaxID=1339234 RepID=UPI0006482E6A